MIKRTLALCLVVLASCSEDDKKPLSKSEMLTNGSSKQWKMVSEAPQDDDPDCRLGTARTNDNAFIFSSNGDFEFDRGTVTVSGGCGDIINVLGNWSFQENETKLLVRITKAKDNPALTFDNDTLFFANIQSLTETSLVVSQDGIEVTLNPR